MYEDEITHIAFADEDMVRHLLALLPADALAGLDTRRLRPLPAELIGRGLRGRVADMAWAVGAPTPQRPHAEVLLAIEFQSAPHRHMALRMESYVALLREEMAAELPSSEGPPPVLPVLVYTGHRRWRPPGVRQLSAPVPPGLRRWQPDLEMLVLSGAHDLSGFLAHKLSAFGDLREGADEADEVAAGDADEKVRGGVRGLDREAPDAGGGGAAAGRVPAHVPAARGPVPRGGAGRAGRQADVAGVVAAGAGGRGAAAGGAVPGALRRVVGGALPRLVPGAARRRAVVHLGEGPAAGGGAGGQGAVAREAPEEARAGAAGGDAGAPGRLHARVGAGRGLGSDRDAGRRHRRGVLGLLRGGGGHLVELPRGARDGAAAGLFLSFYSDRGSHYWHTPEAGGKVDRSNPTQFGRAMAELGIEMIPAYSPEARGRSERHFETIQGRLPNELALEGVRDMAAANDYLRERFWPSCNKRFAVPAREAGDAFVPLGDADLDDILCLKEERVVGRDNCVSYGNRALQIPPGPHGRHYVRRRVRVHEHADGRLSVFHGPRRLARFEADGSLVATT